MNENLNEIFNVDPISGDVITSKGEVVPAEVPHATVEQNVSSDYERTRSNLHVLLTQGQDALIHALELAKQSEHPRAFEVVGNLIKQLSDVNHQLLDLSEKKQKIADKKSADDAPKQVTNNAIFVGSTAELSKLLRSEQ